MYVKFSICKVINGWQCFFQIDMLYKLKFHVMNNALHVLSMVFQLAVCLNGTALAFPTSSKSRGILSQLFPTNLAGSKEVLFHINRCKHLH